MFPQFQQPASFLHVTSQGLSQVCSCALDHLTRSRAILTGLTCAVEAVLLVRVGQRKGRGRGFGPGLHGISHEC